MINLTNRTGYSTRFAAGELSAVLARQEAGAPAGICDKDGTWGHVRWAKACKKDGRGAIFGVELNLVRDMELREKQAVARVKLLAASEAGLKAIYDAVSLATEKFYYIPRIDYGYLAELAKEDSCAIFLSNPDWEELKGVNFNRPANWFFELNQATIPWHLKQARERSLPLVATQDNYFPSPEHRRMYEMVVGEKSVENRTSPMHILTQGEWESHCSRYGEQDMHKALQLSADIGSQFVLKLPHANIVTPEKPYTLEEMCRRGAKQRRCDLSQTVYAERLKYELDLIAEKKFEDYFYVVADMVRFAKTKMLVGPARGSSCGSLVCYLIGITDIDPIPFDLLFERFIDVNREDYPDIDIDFADDRRDLVFQYLGEKYGTESVARLGTVSLFKPKIAITDVGKALKIPAWELKDLKESMIERSGGDARAAMCILDTFQESELGKKILAKYPELAVCAEIEAHPRHTGIHAAGIVLSDRPVTNYCSVDSRNGAAQIDKKDAEDLNLLKIDALGLRTLSVLQDCLDQIGKDGQWLLDYPLDDQKAFDVLNDSRFSGIFQFEGASLKILVSHMRIANIEDIIAATALARPGPLASGGTNEYCKRKAGHSKIKSVHPILDAVTAPTYGIVVYQEQVMSIARNLGGLSWGDVGDLRKAMSKSMGKEFFDRFYEKFEVGALSQGLTKEESKAVWDNINTMGSWAFNRSHAVAYGLVSYWCCILKAHHPLEFALACLRSAKDDEQSVYILRELVQEGFKYVPYDKNKSLAHWSAQDGILVGGLTGIKGCGEKMAKSILEKRSGKVKKAYTKTEQKCLDHGVTPWDYVFACETLWGHLKREGHKYGIATKITDINTINEDHDGTFLVIGKLKQKKVRDANEAILVEKRGGKKVVGQSMFMNLVLEDDTGEILAGISRQLYTKLGKPILDEGKIGEWYLWKGKVSKGFRRINIDRWKKLTDNPDYAPKVD